VHGESVGVVTQDNIGWFKWSTDLVVGYATIGTSRYILWFGCVCSNADCRVEHSRSYWWVYQTRSNVSQP
jgi:hypothetical protein